LTTPATPSRNSGHGFGTAPVFLSSISTILGAVLFLRFGYSVAHAGLLGTILIILIGHLVTLPTALAIAEIATNRKVEGGGEYFIISRSFGKSIGGAIGVWLYLSQALSVAFYMIAFAEAARPLEVWFEIGTGVEFDPRFVSIPTTLLLAWLIVTRGAVLGVRALWVVVTVLAVALVLFFLGSPVAGSTPQTLDAWGRVELHDPFMMVFAIVFPAFTGMTAGVGLSGDLANPRRSIPLGILTATVTGMLVYLAMAWKLAASASPVSLAEDQLIMARIALWGPIVPLGLACATLSSAIGSILVAPRTLQALSADRIVNAPFLNRYLATGHGSANEPRNATLVTVSLALATVASGSVNTVARVISMFFMVTYGALCTISFLEHFAARPSYRPVFRSRWYVSLVGAVTCFLLMLQMDPLFALISIGLMVLVYVGIHLSRGEGGDDLGSILYGVMTQATRYMHTKLQGVRSTDWRPSIVMVNYRTFERAAHVQLLSWLCHRHGFGTYLHLVPGRLEPDTYRESRKLRALLIETIQERESNILVDTMVSPSMRTALAQTLQIPGVSGMENNTVLFEFLLSDPPEEVDELVESCRLATVTRMNSLVLRHSTRFFGNRSEIHIWITWHDQRNANLMILLAYVLAGHPDWANAEIRIFTAYPKDRVEAETERLGEMITLGRLPIAAKNLQIIGTDADVDFDALVESRSSLADLVILGFTRERLAEKGSAVFLRHPTMAECLFVAARQRILIE
jgi:amino acid transporter